MIERLARFDTDLIGGGLYPDLHNQAAQFWQDGYGVMFYGKKMRPFPGGVRLFAPTLLAPITGILDLSPLVTGEPAIVYGSLTKLRLWEATAGDAEVGTGYTGNADETPSTLATRWSFVQWNDWVFATNGVSLPQVYKGASFANADVDTLFTTAEIFLKWRQFLIAFNLSTGKHHIRWCDTDNPEVWTPSASNRARGLFAQDIEGDIRAAQVFGEMVLYFSSNSIFQLEYFGGNDVFGTHRMLSGIGAVGKNAVCSAGGLLYGVGPRGIWQSDGVTFRYTESGMVRDTFRDDVNKEQLSKIVMYNDVRNKHVKMFYPSGEALENDKLMAFNYEEGHWTRARFGRTAASDSGKFDFAVSGDAVGNIYAQSLPEQVSGSAGVQNMTVTEVTGALLNGYGDLGYGALGYGGTVVEG